MAKNPTMRRIKRIHLIGIGGTGMSGIAEVLINLGYEVSGSDLHSSNVIERLKRLGARIYTEHAASNVATADVVVVSSAIRSDNPELVEAAARRIPTIPRALMLAELMRFHYGIAVAGTHGKTTTTSLVATILSDANLDPTFVVGGILNHTSVSAQLGTGSYFVVEADESDASFLHFSPLASIVTNIDADHMGTYHGDIEQLKKGFVNFLHRLPFYGLAVLCYDDPLVREILPEIQRPVITYGFDPLADVVIENFQQNGLKSSFILRKNGDPSYGQLLVNLPGRHNALNATAAAILTYEACEVSFKQISASLEHFSGVGRRIQNYGEMNFAVGPVTVFDDYGHHPREITATIKALKAAFPEKRLVLAFQPHRFTRTRDLADDFVKAFALADQVVLLPIYAASETPISGITSEMLLAKLAYFKEMPSCSVASVEELIALLPSVLQAGDLLLIEGAGSIGAVAPKLQALYKKQ